MYLHWSSTGNLIETDDSGNQAVMPSHVIAPVFIQSARLFTFKCAVDAIADQYAHNLDQQICFHSNDKGSAEETINDPSPLKLLDSIGIWGSI